MDHHPEWLGRDLVAGTLPWEQSVASSVAAFLERFSLQDSHWVGLYSEPEQVSTLLLLWSPEGRRCVLAVRFDALERAEVKLRESRIAGAVSGPTSRAADWHRTHIEDRQGGGATLLHAPNVRLLCLAQDRTAVPLPVPAETL